jgi:hypothetical protein
VESGTLDMESRQRQSYYEWPIVDWLRTSRSGTEATAMVLILQPATGSGAPIEWRLIRKAHSEDHYKAHSFNCICNRRLVTSIQVY